MNVDLINGSFEFIGAFFTWINAYKLWKDKVVMGVYWPVTAFFSIWGIWNLIYYPSLNQMWSFYGGIILVIGNIMWVVLALYYRRVNE
jgi:hypothetical protein